MLSRFEEWAAKNGQLDKFKYAITQAESDKSLIAFPAAGFAVIMYTYSSVLFLPKPLYTPTASILGSSLHFSPLGSAINFTKIIWNPITFQEDLAISGTIRPKSEK